MGFPLKKTGSVVFQREEVHKNLGMGVGGMGRSLTSFRVGSTDGLVITCHRYHRSSNHLGILQIPYIYICFAPRSWLQVAMSEDLIDLLGPQSSQSRFGPVLKGGIRGT